MNNVTKLILFTLIAFLAHGSVYAVNITYTYDAAGRLTKAEYGSSKAIAYTYNNAGNVIKATSTSVSTLADAILVLQVTASMETLSFIHQAGDVNGDGKIGLAEVIYILQKVAGVR